MPIRLAETRLFVRFEPAEHNIFQSSEVAATCFKINGVKPVFLQSNISKYEKEQVCHSSLVNDKIFHNILTSGHYENNLKPEAVQYQSRVEIAIMND